MAVREDRIGGGYVSYDMWNEEKCLLGRIDRAWWLIA